MRTLKRPGLFGQIKREPVIESVMQRGIKRYLEIRNIYHLRLNSGGVSKGDNYIALCPKGTPDLFALYRGVALFIEVKREGEKPTPQQLATHAFIRQSGGRMIVAYSVEDVRAELIKIDGLLGPDHPDGCAAQAA